MTERNKKDYRLSPICRQTAALCITALLVVTGCATPDRLPPPTVRVPTWTPIPTPTPPAPPVAPTIPIPEPEPKSSKIPGVKIVVDAGHGGKDPGAPPIYRACLPEKDIVLMIAGELAELLEDSYAEVIQTRKDDRFIELDRRAEIANQTNADLFVSIHADAAANRDAFGTTIYIEPAAYRQTRQIAQSIKVAIEAAGLKCRGIRQNNARVLRNNRQPAVLIECGYMTNRADAARLNDSVYRGRLARAIADGIINHFEKD